MKTNFQKTLLFATGIILAFTANVNAQSTTPGNSYATTAYVGSNTASAFKDIVFKTSTSTVTTERMRVLGSNGNIGIGGITNPTSKLDIGGGNVALNQGKLLLLNNSDQSEGLMSGHNIFAGHGWLGPILFGASAGVLGTTSGGDYTALTWSTSGVNIPGGLSVGQTITIGVAPIVPGYKLFVQQGILTEKVKVAVATTSDWSDYVFNEDYKLPGINELEAFVKTNKHLPNIPSALDVVKEGIDMAKMDAKLLEKIEELSLYIIELKKENVELAKRMEKVETR